MAVEATGEDLSQFVARAVQTQVEKDKSSLRQGINPATMEKLNQSQEGGAEHE